MKKTVCIKIFGLIMAVILLCGFLPAEVQSKAEGDVEIVTLYDNDLAVRNYVPTYSANSILRTAYVKFAVKIEDTGKLTVELPIPTGGMSIANLYLNEVNDNAELAADMSGALGLVDSLDDGGDWKVELNALLAGVYEFELQFLYQPSIVSFNNINITFRFQKFLFETGDNTGGYGDEDGKGDGEGSWEDEYNSVFRISGCKQWGAEDVPYDGIITLPFNRTLAAVTGGCIRLMKCDNQNQKHDWHDPADLLMVDENDEQIEIDVEIDRNDSSIVYVKPSEYLEGNTIYYLLIEANGIISNDGEYFKGLDLEETVEGIEPAFYFKTGEAPAFLEYKDHSAAWDETLFDRNPNSEDYAGSEKWKDLAIVSGILSGLAYGVESEADHPLMEAYKDIGLRDGDYFNTQSEFLKPGYAFGHKTIERYGKKVELVVATFRGTDNDGGWYDLLTDASEILGGIGKASEDAAKVLNDYLENNNIDAEKAVFLVCGHSLGGGMASGVAKELTETYGASQDNVFGFTYGSPQTGKRGLKEYRNISNFVSVNCGVSYLGSVSWNVTFNVAKSVHIGKIYFVDTPSGKPFSTGHAINSYIKGVKKIEGTGDKSSWFIRNIVIRCPVDVEVYDNDGNLLAAVVDDAVVGEALIPAFTEDGHKYFVIDEGAEYVVKLTGTDEGEMDIYVRDFDMIEYEIGAEEQWLDISLKDGKTMSLEIDSGKVSDAALYLTDGGEKIKKIKSASQAENVDDEGEESEDDFPIVAVIVAVAVGVCLLGGAVALIVILRRKKKA